ncbi:MAG: DUF3990 domain-containing protein [Muribaculaceae bacterium]|nr:DUF3990 domain-containing protein [Muribaculaceae bacterium]
MKLLYHGSNIKITKIDLSKSKPFKDFGQGFYLSDDETQAMDMAKFKSSIEDGSPIVTRFEFDETGLISSTLMTMRFETYSDEWLDFIIANMEGTAKKKYDFVYGPIANDKVGLQLRKYKDELIDKNELLERLKFMKGITFQYFFGSEEAIKYLTLI